MSIPSGCTNSKDPGRKEAASVFMGLCPVNADLLPVALRSQAGSFQVMNLESMNYLAILTLKGGRVLKREEREEQGRQ